jgi:hypothetical protein
VLGVFRAAALVAPVAEPVGFRSHPKSTGGFSMRNQYVRGMHEGTTKHLSATG